MLTQLPPSLLNPLVISAVQSVGGRSDGGKPNGANIENSIWNVQTFPGPATLIIITIRTVTPSTPNFYELNQNIYAASSYTYVDGGEEGMGGAGHREKCPGPRFLTSYHNVGYFLHHIRRSSCI